MAMNYIDMKQKLKHAVQERMDYGRDYTDEEVDELIDETILLREELSLYSVESRWHLTKDLFNSVRKLDILQTFVDDNSITEIMINGTNPIFVEQNGHLKKLDVRFESLEKLEDVIQKIVAGCNRVVNEASPIGCAFVKRVPSKYCIKSDCFERPHCYDPEISRTSDHNASVGGNGITFCGSRRFSKETGAIRI